MKSSKLLLLTAALLLVPVVSFAAPELNGTLDPVKNKYQFNGAVNALTTDGETLYLGGDFTSVGEYTGEAVLFSESGYDVLTFPKFYTEEIDGTVYASISDGDGGWYVGGDFSHVDGVEYTGVVHVLSDGTRDVEFSATLPVGHVGTKALALSPDGETLYVGGGFTSVNGESRTNLAALDAHTGELLPLEFDVEFTCPDTVYALELTSTGDVLYVGGDCMFTQGNVSLAAFNTSDGSETDFDAEIGGPDTVYALALTADDSTLYLGGAFETVNDPTVRNKVAAVDAETGLVTPFDPNVSSTVRAMLLSPDEETLYIGGSFSTVGGEDRDEFAAIDTDTGLVTDLNANIVGAGETVYAIGLSSDEETIYIGGRDFDSIGGQDRTYFGAIDANTGLVTAFDPDMDGDVYTISVANNKVLVGGGFDVVYPVAREEIAAIDLETYELTDFDPQITAPCSCSIYALALSPDGGTLYMGGLLDSVNDGDAVRTNLAAVDTTTALATAFDPNVNNRVYALGVSPDGTTVYAGGSFDEVNGGGELRSYAAAFDASTGVATDFNPTITGEVRDLKISPDGSRVYVTGLFADILALHAGDGATLLDLPNNADDNILSLALSSSGEELYFGGSFSSFPGATVDVGEGGLFDAETGERETVFPLIETVNIETVFDSLPDGSGGWFVVGEFDTVDEEDHNALLHVLADGSVDPNFHYVYPEIDGSISAVALSSDYETLYIGGSFTEIDGTTRNRIAAFDVATGNLTAFDPDVNGQVYELILSPDDSVLYAGGEFTEVNGAASTSRQYLAGFDTGDGVATAFDPDPDLEVRVLEISSDGSVLYAGGNFTEVNGGTDRFYLAGFDTSDGTVTAFDPMIDGDVYSLALSSDDEILYVGGSFESVNDGEYSRYGLAAFTTADGVATSFNPDPDDSPTQALLLSSDDSVLYVGGSFHTISGAERESAAAVYTADGLVTDFTPGISDAGGTIHTISGTQDGKVFMGGSYFYVTLAGGGNRNRIASLDTEDFSLTDFNPGADGTVRSLALSSDDNILYVGGDFSEIGEVGRESLAALNAENAAVLDFEPSLFNPNGTSLLKVALSPDADELYVGGGSLQRLAIFSSDDGDEDDEGGSLSGNKNNRSSGGGGGGGQQGQSSTIGGSQEELIKQLRALIQAFIDAGGTPTPEMLTFLGQGVGDYTRDLQLGDEGPDVLKLQLFLIAQNKGPAAQALAVVGATGYFGPLTQAALAEFQAAVGISPAAGYLGPVTRAYIQGL